MKTHHVRPDDDYESPMPRKEMAEKRKKIIGKKNGVNSVFDKVKVPELNWKPKDDPDRD